MPMTVETMREILAHVRYPDFCFVLHAERQDLYLQIEVDGACNVTGGPMTWRGRKWRLSPHMTPSELVQTAFLAVLTAIEHEARERFAYRGAAIFGPHFDVDRLAALARDPLAADRRAEP